MYLTVQRLIVNTPYGWHYPDPPGAAVICEALSLDYGVPCGFLFLGTASSDSNGSQKPVHYESAVGHACTDW